MHKRLDSPAVTRYPNFNKVKNDHESRVRTSQMEPKMARREDEAQASEDLKAQQNTAQAGLCADTIILTMDGELPALAL